MTTIDKDLSKIKRRLEVDPDDLDAQRQFKSLSSRIFFLQEQQIQNLFKVKYNFRGIKGVEVQNGEQIKFTVKTCKPGLVIGRRAQTIDSIKKDIEGITGKEVIFDIEEGDCDACRREWGESVWSESYYGIKRKKPNFHKGIGFRNPSTWEWSKDQGWLKKDNI